MNKNILVLLLSGFLFLAPVSGHAQNPLKKIYSYKQATISGVNNKAEQKETYNYWVYLVVKKSEHINITEIWLSGKKFTGKTEAVIELPVKKINYTHPPGNDTTILVPFTKNNVFLIYPAGELKDPGPISRYFSDLLSKHELVITYFWKGKKFYKVAGKVTVLEPEALM